jgi:ABC-type bacteriocin/lantibiotic exporter with double-glycine peptidase domain
MRRLRGVLKFCQVLCLLFSHSVLAGGGPLCGPECLYTAMFALDVDPGAYHLFLDRFGNLDERGTTLGRLEEFARERGLYTLTVQTSLKNLQARASEHPFACIAHIDGNHFVLIGDVLPKAVWVTDPPGQSEIAAALFQSRWKGHALLLATHPLLPEEDIHARSYEMRMWSLVAGMGLLGSGLVLMVRRWIRDRCV